MNHPLKNGFSIGEIQLQGSSHPHQHHPLAAAFHWKFSGFFYPEAWQVWYKPRQKPYPTEDGPHGMEAVPWWNSLCVEDLWNGEPPQNKSTLGRGVLQEWQNTISHTGSQAKRSIHNMLAWQCAMIVKEDGTWLYMGVSKNWGTPKWMVYNGKPY